MHERSQRRPEVPEMGDAPEIRIAAGLLGFPSGLSSGPQRALWARVSLAFFFFDKIRAFGGLLLKILKKKKRNSRELRAL